MDNKIKKLAKYIEEHLDSVDGYEGSHYLEWKNKYEMEDFYIKIAEDILNFIKK